MMYVRIAFYATWFGIFIGLMLGLVILRRLNKRFDQDQEDRDLFRQHLLKESHDARTQSESIDPVLTRDRRQSP